MPPKRNTRVKAVPIPAPVNAFAANASAFAPYSESISAVGASRRRITAFGPSAVAPPEMSTDTDTGAEEFIYKILHDEVGNEVLVKTPVANRHAIPIIAGDVTRAAVPPSPTLATAAAQRRSQAVMTGSRSQSRGNSREPSRGRSITRSAPPVDDDVHEQPEENNGDGNDGNGPPGDDDEGSNPFDPPGGGPPGGGGPGGGGPGGGGPPRWPSWRRSPRKR